MFVSVGMRMLVWVSVFVRVGVLFGVVRDFG